MRVVVGDRHRPDHGPAPVERGEGDAADGDVRTRVLPLGGPDADQAAPLHRVDVAAHVHRPGVATAVVPPVPAPPALQVAALEHGDRQGLAVGIVDRVAGDLVPVPGRGAADDVVREVDIRALGIGHIDAAFQGAARVMGSDPQHQRDGSVAVAGIQPAEAVAVGLRQAHRQRRIEEHVVDALVGPTALPVFGGAVVLAADVDHGSQIHGNDSPPAYPEASQRNKPSKPHPDGHGVLRK